jgi:hypothetical protein
MKLSGETLECIKFSDWLNYNPLLKNLYFHIPNERKCTPMHGRILKRMGVRAGVYDYFIMKPSGQYHGLFLEMKFGLNKLSDKQKKFKEHADKEGYKTVTCYTADDAIKATLEYISL